jgi:Rrf2 family protein
MLRLSKKADYALIAMKHLAMKSGAQRGSALPVSAALPAGSVAASAREIAEQYDIPVELMAKVLQRLVRTGLLVSTQGTRGGYTLSRASGTISVGDVIQAIDGPFTVTACSTDNNDCEQYGKCSIRDPLWQIKERIVAALGTVTLAQMANDSVTAAEVPVAIRR